MCHAAAVVVPTAGEAMTRAKGVRAARKAAIQAILGYDGYKIRETNKAMTRALDEYEAAVERRAIRRYLRRRAHAPEIAVSFRTADRTNLNDS